MYTVSTSYFTYSPKTRTFVSEISSLPRTSAPMTPLALTSAKTGKRVEFELVETAFSEDNDLLFWKLWNGELGLKVIIFND